MKYIKDKWNNTRRAHKLTGLLFLQVWFWPQVFDEHMAPNIMLPLIITSSTIFAVNLVKMINAYEGDL